MNGKVSEEYVTLDAFTGHASRGNPLAEDARHTARVRIFTTIRELPFAGHPNVGTGFVMAGLGALFGRKVAGKRGRSRPAFLESVAPGSACTPWRKPAGRADSSP